MCHAIPTKQPSMVALHREAELYLNKLTGPRKTLMEVAQQKVHNYAMFAMETNTLPDLQDATLLEKDDENLALNLGVASLKWLETKHIEQIKVGELTLEKALFELCKFCVSEAIAERDGTKNVPVRPLRSVSVPIKPDTLTKESIPSTSTSPTEKISTTPDSPRKKIFGRRKKRGDSAPAKPLKNLSFGNESSKISDSLSPRGRLQFVMPKTELSMDETIVAIEGSFLKLQPENQKKILKWLQNEKQPNLATQDIMKKIQIKSIMDMCRTLSATDKAKLLKRLSSTPRSI